MWGSFLVFLELSFDSVILLVLLEYYLFVKCYKNFYLNISKKNII